MKYKPSYGDKQRDEQKRRKQEKQVPDNQEQPDSDEKPATPSEADARDKQPPKEKRTA